jgi:hypothetical protein
VYGKASERHRSQLVAPWSAPGRGNPQRAQGIAMTGNSASHAAQRSMAGRWPALRQSTHRGGQSQPAQRSMAL